jgi:hypothetical protein
VSDAVPMIVACALGQGCHRATWEEPLATAVVSDTVPLRVVVRDLTGEPSNPWRTR